MVTYLTEVQRLRMAIEAAGFTRRQVSVRAAANTLCVTIRDHRVTRSVIDEIAASNARAVVRCGTTIADGREDRDLGRTRGRGVVDFGSKGATTSARVAAADRR